MGDSRSHMGDHNGPDRGALVPNRLRERRTEAGLSQEALAHKAGFSVFTVSRMERGRSPSLQTAQAIAVALGLTVSDIWPELTEKAS
jgi:DNA-binding XRE family transcriptional regulator